MAKKRKFKKLPRGWPRKPCWELKYCPFGPLVEFFPLLERDDVDKTCYWGEEEVMKWAPKGQLQLLRDCDPYEISCNVFGHVCPVFVMAEGFTETQEDRYSGRVVPRDMMLKVIRRDDYTCQMCHQHVRDDEIELDHMIPISRGGPTTVDNLRLLCRACNRRKSNSLPALLNEFTVANARHKNP
jgi:hypothetical protein